MYQSYTKKRDSEFSKSFLGEFKDFEEAVEAAEKAIENKPELKYIVEQTTGHTDSYGDLLVEIVAESN